MDRITQQSFLPAVRDLHASRFAPWGIVSYLGANGTYADGIYLVFQCVDACRIGDLGLTLTLITNREITEKQDIKYRIEGGDEYSPGRQGTIPILTDQITRAAPMPCTTCPAYNRFHVSCRPGEKIFIIAWPGNIAYFLY